MKFVQGAAIVLLLLPAFSGCTGVVSTGPAVNAMTPGAKDDLLGFSLTEKHATSLTKYPPNLFHLSQLKSSTALLKTLRPFIAFSGDQHAAILTETYSAYFAKLPKREEAQRPDVSSNRIVYVIHALLRRPVITPQLRFASGSETEVRDAETGDLLAISITGRGRRIASPTYLSKSVSRPTLMGPAIGSGWLEAYNISENFVSGGVYMAEPSLSHKTNGGAEMFVGYQTDVNGYYTSGYDYPVDNLVVGFNLGPINLTTLGTTDYTGPLVVSIVQTGFEDFSWTVSTYTFPNDGDKHWIATVEESANHYLRDILVDGSAVLTGISQTEEKARGSGAVSDLMYAGLWQSGCTLGGCQYTPKYFDHFPNPTYINALWENTSRSASIDPGGYWPLPTVGSGYYISTEVEDPSGQETANASLYDAGPAIGQGPSLEMTP
jgi:hypothetical protein